VNKFNKRGAAEKEEYTIQASIGSVTQGIDFKKKLKIEAAIFLCQSFLN